MGPIAKGWLYEVSHVFSGSMALLVPLWLRLSLGPMREEGGFGSAGRHEEEARLALPVGGGTSFRAHIPTQVAAHLTYAGSQSGSYVKASLFY